MSDTWEDRVAKVSAGIKEMRDEPTGQSWLWFTNNAEQWIATALGYAPTDMQVQVAVKERDAAFDALDRILEVMDSVPGWSRDKDY